MSLVNALEIFRENSTVYEGEHTKFKRLTFIYMLYRAYLSRAFTGSSFSLEFYCNKMRYKPIYSRDNFVPEVQYFLTSISILSLMPTILKRERRGFRAASQLCRIPFSVV
jgi:hypothetical protein